MALRYDYSFIVTTSSYPMTDSATDRTNNEVFSELKSMTQQQMSGLLFFILAAQFMTAIMLCAAIAPDYNFNTSAISDLGVIPSTALIFNISVILVGLLNILGGYLYYNSHRKQWFFAVFMIAGIGAVGAGAFPLNTGGIHSIFALVAFLFFNIQALMCYTTTRGATKIVSLILGLLGLVFVIIMAIGDAGNPAVFGIIGHGGAERMIVYPPMLWLMTFGGNLLGSETNP